MQIRERVLDGCYRNLKQEKIDNSGALQPLFYCSDLSANAMSRSSGNSTETVIDYAMYLLLLPMTVSWRRSGALNLLRKSNCTDCLTKL